MDCLGLQLTWCLFKFGDKGCCYFSNFLAFLIDVIEFLHCCILQPISNFICV